MLNCPLEVHRVPVGDRGDHQVQARGTVLLVLQGPVGEPALPVRVHGLRQGMTRLALVQPGLAATPQGPALQPVDREQRPLDAADLGEREVEAVLPFVGRELPEHGRRCDDAGPDRGGEPKDAVPALGDGVGSDRPAEDRLDPAVGRRWLDRAQALVGEIAQSRHEAVPEQVKRAKT